MEQFKPSGELAEIGRVVLVAARALDGRAASLLGWRLAAERGARARHHALHGADQRGLDAAGDTPEAKIARTHTRNSLKVNFV